MVRVLLGSRYLSGFGNLGDGRGRALGLDAIVSDDHGLNNGSALDDRDFGDGRNDRRDVGVSRLERHRRDLR